MMWVWPMTSTLGPDLAVGCSAPSTSWRSWPSTSPAEADGSKGSILRREGLHSSHIVEWRRARDGGALEAMRAATPGRAKRPAAEVELARLRRRNERLEAELARTRSALDVMGKLHALLEGLSESADTDPKSTR